MNTKATSGIFRGAATDTMTRYSNADFDWSRIDFNGILSTIGNTVTSIFGRGEKYMLSAYQKMYEQQQKTNTVLWVVIGLVVALGVYLVIRKTK